MKKHLFQFLLLAAVLLTGGALVGCSDEVQEQANNADNEAITETSGGENCTLFTSGSEDTRTSMDTDRKFYWSTGDQIYVNTEGTTYKRTSKSTLTTDKRRADFVLDGVSLTATQCSVVYIGNGTTAETAAASELKVKIEKTQTQSEWGNSDHIGASGDCGVAVATKDETTGKYSFDLTHKASYLIFQPYQGLATTENIYYENFKPYAQLQQSSINPDWKLTKIEVVTNGTTKVAGEYDFGTGELKSGINTSDTVTLNCGTDGFTLDNPASSAANSCFAVVQPGQHELTIRYTIKVAGKENVLMMGPAIGPEVEGGLGTLVFEKKIAARTYNTNGVTTIKHSLSLPSPLSYFYLWDGEIPSVDINVGMGSPYCNDVTESPYRDFVTAVNLPKNSCKDVPNVHEMFWYMANGDPYGDITTPWSVDGGLNVFYGGMWFKKKQTILDEGEMFSYDYALWVHDLGDHYNNRNFRPDGIVGYSIEGIPIFGYEWGDAFYPIIPADFRILGGCYEDHYYEVEGFLEGFNAPHPVQPEGVVRNNLDMGGMPAADVIDQYFFLPQLLVVYNTYVSPALIGVSSYIEDHYGEQPGRSNLFSQHCGYWSSTPSEWNTNAYLLALYSGDVRKDENGQWVSDNGGGPFGSSLELTTVGARWQSIVVAPNWFK